MCWCVCILSIFIYLLVYLSNGIINFCFLFFQKSMSKMFRRKFDQLIVGATATSTLFSSWSDSDSMTVDRIFDTVFFWFRCLAEERIFGFLLVDGRLSLFEVRIFGFLLIVSELSSFVWFFLFGISDCDVDVRFNAPFRRLGRLDPAVTCVVLFLSVIFKIDSMSMVLYENGVFSFSPLLLLLLLLLLLQGDLSSAFFLLICSSYAAKIFSKRRLTVDIFIYFLSIFFLLIYAVGFSSFFSTLLGYCSTNGISINDKKNKIDWI